MQSVKQISWAFDNLGITVIWGGKLSLWSEIAFYRDAPFHVFTLKLHSSA